MENKDTMEVINKTQLALVNTNEVAEPLFKWIEKKEW